jgi:Outer membrane protein
MKKIILSLLLLLPLGLFAQELKIAFVDQNQLFAVMPEVSEMESQLATKRKEYEDALKLMQEDYYRKAEDLQQRVDSLTENIRKVRVQELQELEYRMENLSKIGQEDFTKLQESLFAPIQDKVTKAINAVGEENGYSCIMLPQVFLFKGKNIIDATPQVMAKLGLK